MRRYVLRLCIVTTFAITTILFQNCSEYDPKLDTSAGYSVESTSIGESKSYDDATISEIVSKSSINFSQSVFEYSNIWSPI
jgi:hypothetical protein